ncbi:ribose-5-phosphate isomerase RpiA [Sandaracinus amylolyticus]|uniref:ribose-5-phosphate isomerase RpiA n=1 Tax=Sandaracinus amylolyticus TaxID=927083 RepID=UPI001F026032|nr:ribose-5-phosphate isomerase RpiA [Sandaracinus amylolyticus]UJR79483.1 Ribose-5-phosphate isomerase RpiA [Sandaracinus amylolyticus]
MTSPEAWKRAAAEHAADWVRSGMVVGLGAGSTAELALRRIASLLARGALSDILGVPCSRAVGEAAARLGVPLTTLEAHPVIDLTIDGADEVDASFALVKGAGGALLHEKIVAQASRREVIVVDASKPSPCIGTRCALPVEVVPFGWRTEALFLESLGARVQVRAAASGAPFRTDEDNMILDCELGPIRAPHELSRRLAERAGIVEHGLFLDLATDLVIGGADGVRHLTRADEGART